jgi:hypothetical protein
MRSVSSRRSAAAGDVTLRLRGIGVRLVTGYLIDLGGQEIMPGYVVGDGWESYISPGEPVYVGSIRLGVTEVRFKGSPEVLEPLLSRFEMKVLRAGG